MAPWDRCALVALVTTAGCLSPGTARAWTEADVQSVSAEVTVRPDGAAHVAMELTVRVRRGWLQGLEVTGLDPDLVLDPEQPPRWRTLPAGDAAEPPHASPTTEPAPTVRARGGNVQLSFPRNEAPRRGTYRARFAYFSTVEVTRPDPHTARVQWTLPAWRSGLDDVQVRLRLPEGARAASDAEAAPSNVTVERAERDGHTWVTFRRVHLPRTVAWPVAVEVPAQALAPTALPEPEATEASAPVVPPAPRSSHPAPWPVALLLGVMALAKILSHRRAARRHGLHGRGIVPLPWWLRGLGCLGAAAAGVVLYPAHPTLGVAVLLVLPLLTWARTPTGLPPARLGAFRPLGHDERIRSRRAHRLASLAPLAMLHLGSPAGAVLTTGLAAAAAGAVEAWTPQASTAWVHGLVVWLPLALACGPRTLPEPPRARLRHLERLARHLRIPPGPTPPYALRLWVHEDAHGHWQDVRLRVELPQPVPGLVRLDVAVAYVPSRGELRPEPVLLAVARRDSVADDRLDRGRTPPARIEAPGGKVARILPLMPDAATQLATILAALEPAGPPPAHTDDTADGPSVTAPSQPAAA